MSSDLELLKRLYDRFNSRDMDAVIAMMHRDVLWANGTDGGYVSGHDEVRGYWTRQWAVIDRAVLGLDGRDGSLEQFDRADAAFSEGLGEPAGGRNGIVVDNVIGHGSSLHLPSHWHSRRRR
jgi:hypothetical protein